MGRGGVGAAREPGTAPGGGGGGGGVGAGTKPQMRNVCHEVNETSVLSHLLIILPLAFSSDPSVR